MFRQILTNAFVICTVAGIALTQNALAQAPDAHGTEIFSGGTTDWSGFVRQTSDVEYIIKGGTKFYDSGNPDVWLIQVTTKAESEPQISIFPPDGFSFVLHQDNPQTTVMFEIHNDGQDTVSYNLQIESSDSTYILYVDEPDTTTFNGNIWRMRPDGSDKTQLTFEMLDREPIWSPDGNKIVFFSYRSGNADIWIMNADGSYPVNLTNHDSADLNPYWSPDGQYIIFSSNRDEPTYEIYRMTSAGEDVQRLTFNDYRDVRPRYSPDGQYFVAQSRITGSDYDIYVYTSDGQSFINIGIPGVIDYQPSWTPDGKRVVWSSGDHWVGELDIVSANMDGSDFLSEFATPENDYIPRFSPDGQFLAFSKSTFYPMGGDEIFIWNKPLNQLIQITDNTAVTREWGPEWSTFLNAPAWLSVDQNSGQIEPGGSNSVTISIDASNLPLDQHTASVMIYDTVNDNLLAVVPVNIRITDTYAAEILSVTDVPDDQGRWVYLSWLSSVYDFPGEITQYGVWELNPEDEWVSLGNVPAIQAYQYTYLAHTFGDSTMDGIFWSKFKVTAHTTDPGIFFTSQVDSGYSMDNLAPAIPLGLLAFMTGEGTVELTWYPSMDEDFNYFVIYRSMEPDFDPTGMEPFAMTVDTTFNDSDVEIEDTYYYRISAVDFSGNESGYSEAVYATILSIDKDSGIPKEFALQQNYPNPFNPVTTIPYQLPQSGQVHLDIYNIVGQLVETLVNEYQNAGYYSIVWDATEAGSGIYLYRITVTPKDSQNNEYLAVRKCVVLK
jgi:TolB protein